MEISKIIKFLHIKQDREEMHAGEKRRKEEGKSSKSSLSNGEDESRKASQVS